MKCHSCDRWPDPSFYAAHPYPPDGMFSKCEQCRLVFCNDCAQAEDIGDWLQYKCPECGGALKRPAFTDFPDSAARKRMGTAVAAGDVEQLESFLMEYPRLVDVSDNGVTLLHVAAGAGGQGQAEVARVLLDQGAGANARTPGAETPLHFAAWGGHVQVVQLLLARGAQVNAQIEKGGTPLHLAAQQGHVGVAELLLASGADITARDKVGATPLHIAAQEGHLDVAELVPSHGAAVDARAEKGPTPVRWAAAEGHAEVAGLLLAHGAQVGAQADEGLTPLHAAAGKGHVEVVRMLRR